MTPEIFKTEKYFIQNMLHIKRFVNYVVIGFSLLKLLLNTSWHWAGGAQSNVAPADPLCSALPAATGPAPSAISPAASAPPQDPRPSDLGHWWLGLEAARSKEKRCKPRRICYFMKSSTEVLLHTWIIQITLGLHCTKGEWALYFKVGLLTQMERT